MTNAIGQVNANTIIQGLIALVAIGGTFALVLNHTTLPDIVLILDGAITAYYFANVTASNTARAVNIKANEDYNG
jgi:hypothetical protein